MLADAGLLGGLLTLTWWIGIRSTDFVGSPKGWDAVDHAATVQLLVENFPHILWNPAWYAGLPSVPGLYPPLYALMIAAVVTASGASIQHAMVACGAAAFLIMAASLYGFVRAIAKSRTAAALAGLLVLSVPAFWEPSLGSGEYPRLTAMAFGYLATFIAALYTIKPSRLRFTAAVVVTGVAFANHPVTGGLGALQVLGVLVFVSYKPLPDRLRTAGAAATLMGGLAAWLYVPSLIGVRAYYILPQAKFTSSQSNPAAYRYLLYPGDHTLTAFSPILLPLALLLTGVAAVIAWRLRPRADGRFGRALGSSAAMIIVVVCVLGYAFVGRLTHANVALIGIFPDDMFSYAAWPLAAMSGVLVAGLLSLLPRPGCRWWSVPAFGVLYTGAIACLLAMIPIMGMDALADAQAAYAQAPLLPGSTGAGQYRMGLTDTSESEWANAFTQTPQIGGGFSQGAVNLDYIAWAESVLTDPAPSLAEAEFTAQWSGLRWIEAGPTQQGFYQRNPKVFRYMGRSAIFRNYEVRLPSPILAATDTPPVLVIGPYENYNLVLRSLAITDDGPSRVIPVEGSAYIDDYSLAELEQFPVLFLYGFQAHKPARAAKLLDAYVRAGGGVIADVGGDDQLAATLARDGAPLPVTSWRAVELFRSWGFRRLRSPLTRGIELRRFSPALYAGTQPYMVEVGQRLVPESRVALESGSRPLVVTEVAGGLVIESGINLPYHDAVFSNTPESLLLARMIKTATAHRWASGQPAETGAVLTADSDRLQAGSADGMLFKESDTSDWHATVNGQAATVYPAGLGYMYVRLPAGAGAPVNVEFRYQLSTVEWASIVLSVLTLLLLLVYLAGARLPGRFRARLEHVQQRLARRLLPGTTAMRATREVLQEVLADPSAQNRRQASTLLRGEPLQPYADLLLQAVHTERDPACLSELRSLIAETQWEPQASTALAELRQWAAGARGGAALETHVANPT